MAKSKLVKVNEKIAEEVVGGFNKMVDKFVDNFLTKEGESVEEARKRLVEKNLCYTYFLQPKLMQK